MKGKFFYITLGISLVTLIFNIVAFPHLPNKVPVHWGLYSEVNRYGSKIELVMLGGLPLFILFFQQILPMIDPKKESYKLHSKAYSNISFLIVIFLAVVNLAAISSALGYQIPMTKIFPVLLGILFIGTGNYMTQLRHNYFIGIRTPWTLASEYVWKKIHRFGGFIFVIVGLIPLSSIIIGALAMKIFLAALIIGIVATYVYSYQIYKKNA